VLTNDIYRRLIRPNASQKELVLVGRLTTLLVGAITLGVAFLMINLTGEGLFRGMIKLFSIFTAPVAMPMLLGLLSHKMNKNGALAGFLAGVVFGLTLFFLLKEQTSFLGVALQKESILLFGTTILTTVVSVFVSLMYPLSPLDGKQVETFLHRLTIPIGQLDEDKVLVGESGAAMISPFRVVGISIILIGLLMLTILPYVKDKLAFRLDLGIAVVLLIIGGFVGMHGGRRAPKKEQE